MGKIFNPKYIMFALPYYTFLDFKFYNGVFFNNHFFSMVVLSISYDHQHYSSKMASRW